MHETYLIHLSTFSFIKSAKTFSKWKVENVLFSLTHISLESFLWGFGEQCRHKIQTPHDQMFDQELYGLLTEYSIEIEKYHPTPLVFEMDSSY